MLTGHAGGERLNLLQRQPTSVAQPEKSGTGNGTSRNAWVLFLFGLFATSLAITSWFNCCFPHPEVTFVGDAGGYIEEARLVFNLFDLCTGMLALRPWTSISPDEVVKFSWLLQHLPELKLNGPVFPVLLASTFMGISRVIGESQAGWTIVNWYVPLTMQCLLVGLNCVLAAIAGNRLWDKRVGVTAGLLSLAYPGFIVNSGRPTTEMLGCTLVLTIILLSSYIARQKNFLLTFLLGLTLTVLQLSRSAMILLWLMVPVTILFGRTKRELLTAVLALSCGAVCLLGPWSIWQQARFGNVTLIVDRASRYNLFVGQDVQRQGWLTMPYMLPEWAMRSSSSRVVWRSFKTDPVRWLAFQLDKPPRMVKSVWNDFRQSIGPFSIEGQVLFHQAILLMAMVGCSIAFWSRNEDTLIPRLVLLEIVAMHAVYFCFAPVARYNSTAMHGLILLAAAGLVSVVSAIYSKDGRERLSGYLVIGGLISFCALTRMGSLLYSGPLFSTTDPMLIEGCLSVLKCIGLFLFVGGVFHFCTVHRLTSAARVAILVMGITLAPFVALPLRCYGRTAERALPMHAPMSRTIVLSTTEATFAKNNQCYLAIDTDSALNLNNSVVISINEQRIAGPVISGIRLAETYLPTEAPPNYHFRELMFHVLAAASDRDVLNLRQWFYIPVSPELIEKANGSFRIKIAPASPDAKGVVYARFQPINGNYKLPSFSLYAFDKAFYGVESDAALSDPRFDRQVTLASKPASEGSNQNLLVPNVFLVAAPSPGYLKNDNNLALLSHKHIEAVTLEKDVHDGTHSVAIPWSKPLSLEETASVRVRGTLRSKDKQHRAGLDLFIEFENDGKSKSYNAFALPRAIMPGQNFDIAVPMSRPAFEDRRIANVRLILNADSPLNSYYNVPQQTFGSVTFDNLSVDCLTVPSNPCTSKFRIY